MNHHNCLSLPAWLEMAHQTKALLSVHDKSWQCHNTTSRTCISIPFHRFFKSKRESRIQIGEGYLTEPVTVEYPTDNGQTAFMNYYPPKNQDYQLPPGQTPPLLVKIHGGPTSQASTAFNLGYQYWTSRGTLPGQSLCTARSKTHLTAAVAYMPQHK